MESLIVTAVARCQRVAEAQARLDRLLALMEARLDAGLPTESVVYAHMAAVTKRNRMIAEWMEAARP